MNDAETKMTEKESMELIGSVINKAKTYTAKQGCSILSGVGLFYFATLSNL